MYVTQGCDYPGTSLFSLQAVVAGVYLFSMSSTHTCSIISASDMYKGIDIYMTVHQFPSSLPLHTAGVEASGASQEEILNTVSHCDCAVVLFVLSVTRVQFWLYHCFLQTPRIDAMYYT